MKSVHVFDYSFLQFYLTLKKKNACALILCNSIGNCVIKFDIFTSGGCFWRVPPQLQYISVYFYHKMINNCEAWQLKSLVSLTEHEIIV